MAGSLFATHVRKIHIIERTIERHSPTAEKQIEKYQRRQRTLSAEIFTRDRLVRMEPHSVRSVRQSCGPNIFQHLPRNYGKLD